MTVVVLLLTAVWHGLAAWHFVLFPHRTLARTTSERPVNDTAAEVFRFLGGMNVGFVVLALAALALEPAERWPAHIALAAGNATQLAGDLRVKRLDLARGPFFSQITIGDAAFTAANAVAFAVALWG